MIDSGPGSDADPELTGEVQAVVNIGNRFREVPGIEISIARRVGQVNVLPAAEGHSIKEHPVKADQEQQSFADSSLIDLAQPGNQITQEAGQRRMSVKSRRRIVGMKHVVPRAAA